MLRIISGLNWAFYAATALIIYLSWCHQSVIPILFWVVFLAISVPISLWLAKWTERENARLAAEFPDDPFIQAKYGKDRDPNLVEAGRKHGLIT